MTKAVAASLVGICHLGAPCDPPLVDGFEFVPIEDGYYYAEVPEDAAQAMLRVTGFKPFGGKKPSANEAEKAAAAKAEAERIEEEKAAEAAETERVAEAEKAIAADKAAKAAAKAALAAKEKDGK